MKQIEKRMLLQILLGFLLGRVVFFERCPVGAAFFAAGYTIGGSVFPMAVAVCLGMFSAFRIELVIRYATAMLSVAVAADLFMQQKKKIKMGHCAIIMSLTLAVLAVAQYMLLPFQWKDIFYTCMELVLILAFSRLLYEGQRFLLYGTREKGLEHEEMVSLLLMGGMALYGVPNVVIADMSLLEMVIYFVLPVVAYQYGTGMGAVAGALGGVLLVLSGQDGSMVGSLCLLGICTGMLRRNGKVWALSGYLLSAACVGALLNEQLLAVGTWKELLIDSVLLFVIPEKYFRKLHVLERTMDSKWSGEYVQKMLRFRLKDFSDSFDQLSRALNRQSQEKTGLGRRELRNMMQDMSCQVCMHCENRDKCMGQSALTKPETLNVLARAQEDGTLVLEQMPMEFTSECIHPDWFLMETNHSLKMAQAVMSCENKLAQNRQLLAGQMEQVGKLMEELAQDIDEVEEASRELEQVIVKELWKVRVKAEDVAVYRDKTGRYQVHMNASTVRGRLVTSREVAEVLQDVLGKYFRGAKGGHLVVPRTGTDMVFVEEAALYAVTGVARAAKDGEEVSGDVFSCQMLPGGELLMALSDGMGSGEDAYAQSQMVMELLEQMAEAGFSQISALKLINSLYMPEAEGGYATADMVIVDMYQGECQFVKNGAAATWIRRGEEMFRIEGQALPVGVVKEAEPYLEKTKIYSGDYVIMMTDGVVDAFDGREEELEQLLGSVEIINPQELASFILDEAVAGYGGENRDDMSVIVAGIWRK